MRKFEQKQFFWLASAFFLLVVIFLSWRQVCPSGRFQAERDFSQPFWNILGGTGPVVKIGPSARAKILPNQGLWVYGDPAYLTVYAPRTFDQVKIRIRYKAELGSSSPAISLGVLYGQGDLRRYALALLADQRLDEIIKKWPYQLRQENLLLLEQKPVYDTVSSFLVDLAEGKVNELFSASKIAIFNYPPEGDVNNNPVLPKLPDLQLLGYQKNSEEYEAAHSLRGSYEYFVYLKDENLQADFLVKTIPLEPGEEPIKDGKILIFKNSQPVYSQTFSAKEISSGRAISLRVPGLAAGLYKVEWQADNRVVTDKLKTINHKLVFWRRLTIAEGNFSESIFSGQKMISIKAATPAGRQSVFFGGKECKIVDSYERYDCQAAGGVDSLAELSFSKGALILESDGAFSFSADTWFNPNWPQLIEKESVDFALVVIPQIEEKEGWQEAEVILPLKGAYREGNYYQLAVSVPGLKAEDNLDQGVLIQNLSFDFSGRTLQEKIKSYVPKN